MATWWKIVLCIELVLNTFFWPQHADNLWYAKVKIITLLDSVPELVTERHRLLQRSIWEEIAKELDL